MPLLFQILASGSKGNSILISSPGTRILLDAGTTGRELVRRLGCTFCSEPKQLDALLISHEHSDHVNAAGVLSRRFDLPVYMSRGTSKNLPPQVGEFSGACFFSAGTPFCIGDIQIRAFPTPHDAEEPSGFVFEHNGCRLGVCTDLGVATQLVRTRLRGCHGLVIEANHDVDMLMNGPYPWFLKQRIRSRHGHLSNSDTRDLIEDLHHPELQALAFAHLSETNNRPDLVVDSTRALLCTPEWQCVRVQIGMQDRPGDAVELNA